MLTQEMAIYETQRPTQAHKVYIHLKTHPNSTIEDIARSLEIKESSVCARLNELKDFKDVFGNPVPLVEYDDKFLNLNSSGRKAGVWRLIKRENFLS